MAQKVQISRTFRRLAPTFNTAHNLKKPDFCAFFCFSILKDLIFEKKKLKHPREHNVDVFAKNSSVFKSYLIYVSVTHLYYYKKSHFQISSSLIKSIKNAGDQLNFIRKTELNSASSFSFSRFAQSFHTKRFFLFLSCLNILFFFFKEKTTDFIC